MNEEESQLEKERKALKVEQDLLWDRRKREIIEEILKVVREEIAELKPKRK